MTSFLSFPGCSHPGFVVAPSPGFDFAGLVASGSSELGAGPLRSLAPSHSGVCAVRVGVPPCSLAHCGAPWLMAFRPGHYRITAGLASLDGPLLVSSVESQLCECPFVGLLHQLVGSGACSPASPICPTSSVMKRSSFGISASVFASSLRDEVTLPGRVCFSPRSERRLFLHLPGVWLVSSRWGHPVGSSLSQISIGTKTLRAPSLVVGAKPSRWGHPFRVVWRISAHSIRTKASSVHLSLVASQWGHPAGRVCFSHARS